MYVCYVNTKKMTPIIKENHTECYFFFFVNLEERSLKKVESHCLKIMVLYFY